MSIMNEPGLGTFLSDEDAEALTYRHRDHLERIIQKLGVENADRLKSHIYTETGNDAFTVYYRIRDKLIEARIYAAIGATTVMVSANSFYQAYQDPNIVADSVGIVGATTGFILGAALTTYGLLRNVFRSQQYSFINSKIKELSKLNNSENKNEN